MRLGIFYYGTEAKNRGLGQLSQSLYELGYEPLIVTRSPKSGEIVREFNNTPVIQIPLSLGYWPHITSTPLPLNFFWKQWTMQLVRKYRLKGIFVRETPLSYQILSAAKRLHIPVFLDLRENLGAMYAAGNKNKPFRRLLRQKSFVQFYESLVIPRFKHVFTVSDELGIWAIKKYKISSHTVSTLGNYPSKIFLDQAEKAIRKKNGETQSGVMRLVYAGFITQNRGLQDIIIAISILLEKQVNILLSIIGKGSYLNNLKSLVSRMGMEKRVEFHPMLPPDNVAETLAGYNMGICADLLNEQTHQTLPGKLFEYMAVGLPVLCSARKPVKRIVEETGCGLIYNSRRSEVIAETISKLVSDRQQMEEMGRKGRKAVLRHYNWKTNLDTLNSVLEKFLCLRMGR